MTIHLSGKGGGASEPFFNEPTRATQYFSGKYYGPSVNYSGTNGGFLNLNTIFFLPFVPLVTHIFTGVAFFRPDINYSGTVVRMGVYSANSNGNPGTLLGEVGPITVTTAGLHVITCSWTLIAKTKYWLAFLAGAGETSYLYTSALHPLSPGDNVGFSSPSFPSFGINPVEITGVTGGSRGFTPPRAAYTYAALPTTAPILTSGDTTTFFHMPLMWLKG